MDRVQQRRKAVRKAREVLDAEGSNCTRATIQQISNIEVLQSVLHDLDVAQLPPTSKAYCELPALNQQSIGLAIDSLTDLAVIFGALNAALLQSPALQATMDDGLALLLLQWGDITTWIIFLIRGGSPSSFEWTNVLLSSIDILEMIVEQSEENQYRKQFISQPSTIDILLLLLSLTDSRTRKPIVLPSILTGACLIARIFATYAKDEAVQQNVESRLLSLGRKRSRQFTSSLLFRVQDLAKREDTRHPSAAGETLFHLFAGALAFLLTDSLKRDFQRIDFVVELARAMRTIVEKGVTLKLQNGMYWQHIAECIIFLFTLATTRQSRLLGYKAVSGGVLPCLFHALPLASVPDGLQREALRTLYLLTDSRAFRAARAVKSMDTLETCAQGASESQRARFVYNAYSLAFRRASLAFDGRKTVAVCCSLKHQSPPIGLDEVKKLKRCARCRLYFYCSESCQMEDWTSFHSEECRKISEGYWGLEIGRFYVTPRIVRDKLLYLQSVANRSLPSLAELKGKQRRRLQGDDLAASSVYYFDLRMSFDTGTTHESIEGRRVDLSLSEYLKGMGHLMVWQTHGRTQSLVADMEANQSSIALVEGMFTINEHAFLTVTATMRYSPHEEECYKVKSSMFRVTINSPAARNDSP